jgi:hypothetical protein
MAKLAEKRIVRVKWKERRIPAGSLRRIIGLLTQRENKYFLRK